jgi:hypothetical protein
MKNPIIVGTYALKSLGGDFSDVFSSVTDPGCFSRSRIDFFPSRIPDPNFFHPGSVSTILSILTPKNGFQALGNMIWVVHPGS